MSAMMSLLVHAAVLALTLAAAGATTQAATANAAVRQLECREHNSFGDDRVYQFSFDDTTNHVSVEGSDLGGIKEWKVQLAKLPEILVISGIVPAEHPGVIWVIDLDFSRPEMSLYPIGSGKGAVSPRNIPVREERLTRIDRAVELSDFIVAIHAEALRAAEQGPVSPAALKLHPSTNLVGNEPMIARAILALVLAAAGTAAQAEPNKELYELQERCGRDAAEFSRQGREPDSYQNHYSAKLNKCFYLETITIPVSGTTTITHVLYDVNDHKQYGSITKAFDPR